MDLQGIRVQIDALDQRILHDFEERMELCKQVAMYKKEHQLPIFQAEREASLLQKIEQMAKPGMEEASRTLFTVLMDISKKLQSEMLTSMEEPPLFPEPDFAAATKIGCQGMEGSNSEQASKMLFPEREIQFYPTFEQVFQAVESGEIEFGVLPAYNSTSGSITQTFDLMGKYNFFITAMNQVELTHCIAAVPGTKLDEVQMVYSHPQALTQCSDFLEKYHLRSCDYSNTATAAAFVAQQQEHSIAAICSEECAKQHGLEIMESKISNVLPNYTRFICITKKPMISEKATIISFMMKLPHHPGSLSRVLNQFFLQGLDLVRLESRPIQDGSFDVVFYVDFKGNLRDRSIAAFLNELCTTCQEFKLLGNAVIF